ncbi:Peptidyl-tRNA hydrolase [Trichinella spiralis]|uniref:Peptidyl-tRNA hydrolase n=1 Tax=Trichinella spiralis TaxID=6334 RepID=A0ABR3K1B9_TRISP
MVPLGKSRPKWQTQSKNHNKMEGTVYVVFHRKCILLHQYWKIFHFSFTLAQIWTLLHHPLHMLHVVLLLVKYSSFLLGLFEQAKQNLNRMTLTVCSEPSKR